MNILRDGGSGLPSLDELSAVGWHSEECSLKQPSLKVFTALQLICREKSMCIPSALLQHVGVLQYLWDTLMSMQLIIHSASHLRFCVFEAHL